jgi:hypothetical protein
LPVEVPNDTRKGRTSGISTSESSIASTRLTAWPPGRGEDVRRALPVERDADAAGGEGPFDRAGDRVAPAIGTGRVGRAHLEVLAWDRDRDRSPIDTLDRLRLSTSVANQVGGARRGTGAGLPPEIPCDEGPVAALPDVQRVSHRPVEITLETVDHRAQLADVEPRVPRQQRIERPSHPVDPLVERLRALRELEGGPDAAVPAVGDRGEHVRVHVQAAIVDAGPSEDEPDEPIAVDSAPRDVAAGGEGSHHLTVQMLAAPRSIDHVVDPVGVLDGDERLERDARRARRVARERPRVGHGARA